MADYELSVGQMVGEYRVERKIGEGGFGKVYAAVHPVIGKAAAVKILNPDLAKNQEMVSRFVDEARAVNQIRHRNIIDIFAFGTLPNGLHYFVMELLEGMSLDAYLKQNAPLDPAHALSILWTVGRALVAAHKAGIAHRDLKPENVFLTFDHDGGIFPKLLDFGIAKLLHESEMAHRTRTGMMMGTPLYMSPEQCRGSQVDHRSDIYSFGIMTHEVLTGRQPFWAENMMDLIIKQIGEPPPPMSSSRPDLPRALDAAVLRMLEKSAESRPPTMQAALDGLLGAAKQSGIDVPATIQPIAHRQHSESVPGAGSAAAPGAGGAQRAPGPADPTLDTGAWLQQGGAGPSVAVAGATAPGSPAAPSGAPPVKTAPATGHRPARGSFTPAAGHAAQGAQHTERGSWGGRPGGYPHAHSPPAGPAYPHAHPHAHSPSAVPAYPAAPTMQSAGHALPARPSSSTVGLYAALAGALFLLFVVVVVGLRALTDDASVEIGTSVPAPGTSFDRDTTADLTMKLTAPGEAEPRLTIHRRAHRWQRITIRAVDGERASWVDVQYGDNSVKTTSNGVNEESEVVPTANRTFMAILRGNAVDVMTAERAPVGPEEQKEVLQDVEPLFHPPADVFGPALVIGSTITVPSDRMLDLVGFAEPDPGTTIRADNATLALRSIEPGGRKATFDVAFLYVEDGTRPLLHTKALLVGTVTIDVPTGLALAGALSGPLEGTLTNDEGTKLAITGGMNIDSH